MAGRPDRALVEQRRARAVQLHAEGHDYDEIALELGFSHRSGAWKCVQAALRAHTADAIDELRALEVARLDALQAGIWPDALAGDVAAVLAVVRIVELRTRLLGLRQGGAAAKAAPASLLVRP